MIYSVNDYDFEKLENIPIQKQKSGKHSRKEKYLDLITAFDIETTNLDNIRNAVMYIWQFQIEDDTIIGRSWEEFRRLCGILSSIAGDAFIVCFVHNLSFEYQFIRTVIHIDSCFAMDNRKILKCVSDHIEFRCSYLHSNMSLKKYLQSMDVPDQKVSGFDYNKKRYPWTDLTDEEIHYCINDVRGLVQAVKTEIDRDNDNLYTFPLTSTGYERREAKAVLGGYRKYIHNMLPDYDIFHALRMAFRGGNTHANRYNANIILTGVSSYDISSSYNAQALNHRFPGKFVKSDPQLLWLFLKHDQACLIHCRFYNIHLKDDMFGCPYIPRAKCENISNAEYDNGRILEADQIEMYLTEIDLSIIECEYEFEFEVLELWTANKMKLPAKFRAMLLDQYRKKTLLKGSDEYLYQKYKGKFNAAYGMMVQNPCKPEWALQDDGMLLLDDSKSVLELIEEYQKKGWLPYQWGVWICAYARLQLEEAIQSIPYDQFVYADTDSVKYLGDHDHTFEWINKKYINPKLCAKDKNGNDHYIGVFEKDAEYRRFITMGAKKYAYEEMDGSLHVTVSGVDKKEGAAELGKLENFKEGFVFRKAGGTEHVYNDHPDIDHIKIDGHDLDIISNVYITESTYTLDQTIEYKRLIAYLCGHDIRYDLHYER